MFACIFLGIGYFFGSARVVRGWGGGGVMVNIFVGFSEGVLGVCFRGKEGEGVNSFALATWKELWIMLGLYWGAFRGVYLNHISPTTTRFGFCLKWSL